MEELGTPSLFKLLENLIEDLEALLNHGSRNKLQEPKSTPSMAQLERTVSVAHSISQNSAENRTCFACHKKIDHEEANVDYNGRFYHVAHFTCSFAKCGKNLANLPVFERNSEIVCSDCYHSAYSPKCAYCKQIIKHVLLSYVY